MAIVERWSVGYWRHQWIRLQVRRWIVPVLCAVPYLLCIVWMLMRDLVWLAQIMLAPLLMGSVLGLLTWRLAQLEFREQRRTR